MTVSRDKAVHAPLAFLLFAGALSAFQPVTTDGAAVAGAVVDVWHASTVGFYENQDPSQADWNLRGRFITDADGAFSFRSIRPSGYPIPIDGPVGELLAVQHRHNRRPAHLHFMVHKDGFKTIASQLYTAGHPDLETDVQFGVTKALLVEYVATKNEQAEGPAWSLDYTFVIEPGEARRPPPPVTGRAVSQPAPLPAQ